MLCQVPLKRCTWSHNRHRNNDSEDSHANITDVYNLEAELGCYRAGNMLHYCMFHSHDQGSPEHCMQDANVMLSEAGFSDDLWLLTIHQVSFLAVPECFVFMLKYHMP